MDHMNSFDSPVLSRDPNVVQEILNSVEERYYSMTFDSGKYEIESLAGPSCRELSKLKIRLLFLDKQNKAVSRRVSELVLEKHPMYEAELNGVLSLQADNWETLALCRRIRRPIHVKLQAFGMRIEDLLDAELQMNCDNFSEQSYCTVQQAFELLGSTQTTFAQMQMHFIASIQRRTLTIVQSFVCPSADDSEQPCSSRDYADMCL
ncbi:unnamed protein product, partial [Echinostoma caproni]|uniref:DUF4476 domain-containing protein n=1 Tax=Echinostoma caproni TaxID=27848 RepID=A0A183AMK0_9TREM